MSAVDALRTGDLAQALADLQSEVRSSPEDPRHRVFLVPTARGARPMGPSVGAA